MVETLFVERLLTDRQLTEGQYVQRTKFKVSGNFSIRFLRQYVPLFASIGTFVVPIVDFRYKKSLLFTLKRENITFSQTNSFENKGMLSIKII